MVGDGVVALPGLDDAVGPTSGVALVAAAWAILVGAADRLLEQGLTPVVYRSVQIPGAETLFHERQQPMPRAAGAPCRLVTPGDAWPLRGRCGQVEVRGDRE